jgi:hypothetical protein
MRTMVYKGRAGDVENHMVVGPDSFDEVVECKHEEWSHGEAEDITNMEISFSVTCDGCSEEGYVIYRPSFSDTYNPKVHGKTKLYNGLVIEGEVMW